MIDFARSRRWPAYAMTVLLLGYAAGKAAFAMQSRLGFPGGPVVPAAEAERYFLDPATAQWCAAATGVLGAGLALATVTPLVRRVPRPLMLLVLAGMVLAVGGGAAIMVLDGFLGMGIGWQWYHGIFGVVVIALLLAMTRSYVTGTKQRVAR
jgi:hypothetical protein